MSDLDVLRELVGHVRPPGYDELVVVARRRRRRAAGLTAAGVAVVVLAVGLAGGGTFDGRRALEPVEDPSRLQSERPSTGPGWTPERTRAEGSPVDFLARRSGPSPSGLDARLYCVGTEGPTGSPCDPYHPYDPAEDQHWAVEVTQGGQSALFDVRGAPFARDFDEDSILVQDGTDRDVRFRLLQADGTAVRLRLVDARTAAAPGPGVLLIQDLATYRRGSFDGSGGPGERPYLVDDRAGTLHPLDVPQAITWWGPNVDELLWGGSGCRVFWQRPGGGFDHHDADCRSGGVGHTDPGWNWVGFADWLEPGRLALVEWRTDGSPRAVHASVDGGATWQRIEVEDRSWSGTAQEIGDALGDALGPLG